MGGGAAEAGVPVEEQGAQLVEGAASRRMRRSASDWRVREQVRPVAGTAAMVTGSASLQAGAGPGLGGMRIASVPIPSSATTET